ncbi:MAG: CocE/NonD family hydrolase, partial [Terriglobales bacterium]
LVQDGYIFAFQDIRGRFKSEGKFVMQRPPRENPHGIDESTDTYDTIDWLVKNVPHNNGRVGMLGISYGGWLTAMGLLGPHPALKAVSEQASPADMFIGDDFHHNGAFRLSYGFEYAAMMETGKTNFRFGFGSYDTFPWYLALGPLANVNRNLLHGSLPTWNDFVAHPNYDEFWQRQAFYPHLKDLTLQVPDLNVAGWWDQEDFYGPVKIYQTLLPHDAKHNDYLVVGPWNHGGWATGAGDHLGPIQFGSATAQYFRARIEAPWFAYWLKGKGALPLRRALTFQSGSNRWEASDAWPPVEGIARESLYLQAGGELTAAAPIAGAATEFDQYSSDPAHPVPYRPRPIEETYGPGSRWYTWLVGDQRFVESRPDVASWKTPPLAAAVCLEGEVHAHLFASTSGTDSDWVVKLIDQYPAEDRRQMSMSGYQLMIADEVFRARFRDSFEHPAALVPNQVTPYVMDLHSNNHCFLPGHRIMVEVQSTWFPLIDRNPQTFVANIFQARASDFRAAEQRIYRTPAYPSRVEFSRTVRGERAGTPPGRPR